ncbi:hypothetical protein ACKAMS_22700 [Rhodococcus sp. 5A-K4]|uniref:VG15 protein n=1 Tax=Rhodococcus sp. 5A-K4 TaxID=3384442 RepID=UPI0038D4444B
MARTKLGRKLTELHRRAQLRLSAQVVADLRRAWRILAFQRLDETQGPWLQVAVPVIEAAHMQSQEISAQYVQDFRAAERPELRPIPWVEPVRTVLGEDRSPAPVPVPESTAKPSARSRVTDSSQSGQSARSRARVTDPEAAERGTRSRARVTDNTAPTTRARSRSRVSVAEPIELDLDRTARGLLITGPVRARKLMPAPEADAMDKAFVSSTSAAVRMVAEGGRDFTQKIVELDREALGFARVTKAEPCWFCAMLASLGAVYKGQTSFSSTDARYTGGGTAKVHDGCQCTLEPIYDETADLPDRTAEFRALWDEATAGASGHEATVLFRRAYEGRTQENDPAHPDTPKEPEKGSDEYKRALAERLLPKFESQLETLLADGRGEDSEPVIYHRAQIARHREALGLGPGEKTPETKASGGSTPPPKAPSTRSVASGDEGDTWRVPDAEVPAQYPEVGGDGGGVPFTPDQRPSVDARFAHIADGDKNRDGKIVSGGHRFGSNVIGKDGRPKEEFPDVPDTQLKAMIDRALADPTSITRRGGQMDFRRIVDGCPVVVRVRGREGPGRINTAYPAWKELERARTTGEGRLLWGL